MFTGVDTYKWFTSCLLLSKTYFLIVFHSYHVTYYYLYCLLFNVVCFEINWIELYCIVLDWIGLDWIGLDWIGLDWIGLNWIELNWIELNWIELNWIELNWIELNCLLREPLNFITRFAPSPPIIAHQWSTSPIWLSPTEIYDGRLHN